MAVSKEDYLEHSGIYRYQRVGRHAVRQEIRGFFREAAEAWLNAARWHPVSMAGFCPEEGIWHAGVSADIKITPVAELRGSGLYGRSLLL